MFFTTFAIYLFLGTYIIHRNPYTTLNRLFFVSCIALGVWSFAFSMANFAPDLESCLLWRRVSALGWGTIYAFLLHLFLLITKTKVFKNQNRFIPLLYLPALICLYAFAISPEITATQYNLVKVSHGWINVTVQNGWTKFFNIYYITYMFACLAVTWNWKRNSADPSIHKQANILLIAITFPLVLGSLTDVILNVLFAGPFPQMAPVFILIPGAAIYYSVRHYSLMPEVDSDQDELILSQRNQARLCYYISTSFIGASLLAFSSYFFSDMLQDYNKVITLMYVSGLLLLIGISILGFQTLKSRKAMHQLTIAIMLLSIPVLILTFMNYDSITIWAFPLIIIIFSLLFNTIIPLAAATFITIVTQLIIWKYAPVNTLQIDSYVYVLRIGILLIAFWAGTFVNRTYIGRIKENIAQIQFQKLVSNVSFDFVSVSQTNIDGKINDMLKKAGSFFQVDHAYVYLINFEDNTMTRSHNWHHQKAAHMDLALRQLPLDICPWWMSELRENKKVYIEKVSELPEDAAVEKGQLSRRGVQSTVALPIEEDGMLLGYIELDSIAAPKKWSDYDIELLGILSNILADGLIKIESEKKIEYLAYYDQLTDLPNRTLFSDRLTKAIHLAERSDLYLGIILVDLDVFKTINDTIGHSGGDEVLKEVGRGIAKHIKKMDTVARFGGDEFIIMIHNLDDKDKIYDITGRIIDIFREPFTVKGQEVFVTASAGVAIYPADGIDAETLIKNADTALHKAKDNGKNQYTLCTEEMKKEVNKNISLSNNLYRVVERDELILYYQPQVNLMTGEIVGLEALLRWNHPELGMIPPNVFIPLAEMNGTINEIGEWVLINAINQNKAYQDMGLPPLRIAVNLSLNQLNNPDFVQSVEQILEESELDPKYIELEITESIATKEASHIIKTLNQLKQLGVSIAIDDFGTEYSSLNRLKILPIDRIKIDMQFVKGIEGNEKDRAITRVIINLGKSLGLEVLAEGVETIPQLQFLSQGMCDEAQGYYYHKPMPAKEIEKLLSSP